MLYVHRYVHRYTHIYVYIYFIDLFWMTNIRVHQVQSFQSSGPLQKFFSTHDSVVNLMCGHSVIFVAGWEDCWGRGISIVILNENGT